jgi:hypothetical protein
MIITLNLFHIATFTSTGLLCLKLLSLIDVEWKVVFLPLVIYLTGVALLHLLMAVIAFLAHIFFSDK